MFRNIFHFCLIILWAFDVKSQTYDYYWRDYNGVIPQDALPGGEDRNGNNIYIGQVYIHEYGLCISPIFPGKEGVEFFCRGETRRPSNAVKILCTKHKSNFVWLATTSPTFHQDTANKHLVIGGRDALAVNHFDYYIGRIVFDGVVQIGLIDTWFEDTVYLYIVHQGAQYTNLTSYEVLINEQVAKK